MSNSTNPTPPSRGIGLSLYANLLDPDGASSSATVSKGPVVFKPAESPDDASTRKPQIDPGIWETPWRYDQSSLLTVLNSRPAIPTYKKTTIVAKTKT
jgi:hypothetical protein